MRRILSRPVVVVSLIFVLAVGVRLIYMVQTTSSPLYRAYYVDTQWHAEWAQRIAGGQWTENRPFFRAPFYPFVLAGLYRLSGSSFTGAKIAQHLLGALSCLLVYSIARRTWNQRVAMISGIIAALYGPLMYFENELLLESLLIFLMLAGTWVFISAGETPRGWKLWVGGLLLGLGAITRPNVLLIVPAVLVWWLVAKHPLRSQRRKLIDLCWIGLGVVIPIAPVTLHNVITGGEWVLISTQGGINFWIGNNSNADGKTAVAPGAFTPFADQYADNVWVSSKQEAERVTGKSLSDGEVSRYWFQRGVVYWLEQPASATFLLVKKIYYFLNGFEIESNRSMYLDRLWSWIFWVLTWDGVPAFPFGVMIPLALVGLFLRAENHRNVMLLRACAVVYSLSVIMFFVNGRFRIPVVPLLIPFAAAMAVGIYDMIRRREHARFKVLVPVVLVGLAISNSSWWNVRAVDMARQASILAYAQVQQNQFESAVHYYRQALQEDSTRVADRYNLGSALLKLGRPDEARVEYEKALVQEPSNPDISNMLGNCWLGLGDPARAVEYYRRAVALNPKFSKAWINLGIVMLGEQEYVQAENAFARAIEQDRNSARYYYLRGLALRGLNRNREAEESFGQAIRLDPGFATRIPPVIQPQDDVDNHE